MAKYRKIGEGSYGIYKKEEPPVWPWVVGIFLVLALLGSCSS